MTTIKAITKDPICGMTVDEATALHAERDGEAFYFCSDHCRKKFLSAHTGAKPEEKSRGCCGYHTKLKRAARRVARESDRVTVADAEHFTLKNAYK